MKTWTDTLTLSALAAVLLLGGCTSGDGSVSLEVDEEAVAEVLAELDEMRVARLSLVRPGLPQPPPGKPRKLDPDQDDKWIRAYAKGAKMASESGSPVILNEAETDLLLDLMKAPREQQSADKPPRAPGAARRRAGRAP